MRSQMKKSLVVLLTLVMMFAMNAAAFASNTDPNFTKSGNTAYTYRVVQNSGSIVTLQVGPADSSWAFTGFSTAAEAANVTWSPQYGSDLMSMGTPTVVDLGGGVFVNQIVLTTQSNYGAYGIRATWNNGASTLPTMDFTINVDPATMQAAKTGITVDVQAPAAGGLAAWNDINTNITATPVGISTTNPLCDTLAIQKYSTPFAALVAMFNTNPTSANWKTFLNTGIFQSNGTYLSSIIGYTGYNKLTHVAATQARAAADMSGWKYCVYRGSDLHKIAMSDTIGASGFALNNGDTVVWRYCDYTYTFPANYTPM